MAHSIWQWKYLKVQVVRPFWAWLVFHGKKFHPHYKEGEVIRLPQSIANDYIKRGFVVISKDKITSKFYIKHCRKLMREELIKTRLIKDVVSGKIITIKKTLIFLKISFFY